MMIHVQRNIDEGNKGEDGFALSSVLLVLTLLLAMATATAINTSLDLKSTAHFDTGNGAFYAAEAGVLHGLSSMNAVGVTRFKVDVVDRWATVFGPSIKTMPSNPKISYQVTVAANPADPNDLGTLSVTGFAPLQAQRAIVVGIARGGFVGSPGAIYLASDSVDAAFSGNAFNVDGDDHDTLAEFVPGGIAKPGISTRTDSVTDEVIASLNYAQKNNVRGLGFNLNPLTPSVLNTGGPDVHDLERIVGNILSSPSVVTTNTKNFNGDDKFGTLQSPQITHMTNNDVQLNGNAFGSGILVVDGSVTINGTLDFVGWIIVRGATIINVVEDDDDSTVLLGNATILGSLWTGHLEIKVGGKAIVDSPAPSTCRFRPRRSRWSTVAAPCISSPTCRRRSTRWLASSSPEAVSPPPYFDNWGPRAVEAPVPACTRFEPASRRNARSRRFRRRHPVAPLVALAGPLRAKGKVEAELKAFRGPQFSVIVSEVCATQPT